MFSGKDSNLLNPILNQYNLVRFEIELGNSIKLLLSNNIE